MWQEGRWKKRVLRLDSRAHREERGGMLSILWKNNGAKEGKDAEQRWSSRREPHNGTSEKKDPLTQYMRIQILLLIGIKSSINSMVWMCRNRGSHWK